MELIRCNVVNRYQLLRRTSCSLPVSWWWRPKINLKCTDCNLEFYHFSSEKNIIRIWRFKSSRIWWHVDWQIFTDLSVGPVVSASKGQKFQVYWTSCQISKDLQFHHCNENHKSHMLRWNIHWCIKAGLLFLFYFQWVWDMQKISTDFIIEVLTRNSTLFILLRVVWVTDIQLCVLLTVHHAMILGNCPTWRTNSFQYIYL